MHLQLELDTDVLGNGYRDRPFSEDSPDLTGMN